MHMHKQTCMHKHIHKRTNAHMHANMCTHTKTKKKKTHTSYGKYECERDFCFGWSGDLSSTMVEHLTRIQEICGSNPG